MSAELPVEVVRIDSIEPHQNPTVERLEVARIGGWTCIVGRGQFRPGDIAIFVPDDAVLPPVLIETVFAGSKIKPQGGRIRPIRIRGQFSQGLLLKPDAVGLLVDTQCVGSDVGDLLGITKYEPPAPRVTGPSLGRVRSKKDGVNPHFRKYTKIKRIEWMPGLFAPGDAVVITEKIHGTNFRAGWLPRELRWYEKAWKWLGGTVAPRYEFVVGSHYKQLADGGEEYQGFYDKKIGNVYLEAVEKYDLRTKLKPGEVVYGEVYGHGVQKGYTYGCADGERRLVIFDVEVQADDQRVFLDHFVVADFCTDRGLPMVPMLYVGPFGKDVLKSCTTGASVLDPNEGVREGCVIRPLHEARTPMGRKIQKSINPDYDMIPVGQRSDNH